jgi:hypothetical protein
VFIHIYIGFFFFLIVLFVLALHISPLQSVEEV